MRRDDPKRLKLRADRERARAWLDILCKGIGETLTHGYNAPEDLRLIIEKVNGELEEAVGACERAEKAYEPYWSRRRIRIHRAGATKKKRAA